MSQHGVTNGTAGSSDNEFRSCCFLSITPLFSESPACRVHERSKWIGHPKIDVVDQC